MRYLSAILALSVLVALHELGHLIAARAFGIRVRRFTFGFGPPIVTLHRRTEWVIGAIPLGGSAQLVGMNPHDASDDATAPDAFRQKAWWKRLLVLASGSLFNLAVAIGTLAALVLSGTHLPVKMTVGTVEPGSEAARAQLRPGDRIVEVDGVPVADWGEFVESIQDSPNKRLRLTVRRGVETQLLDVTPRPDEAGIGRIGVSQQYVFRALTFGEAFAQSLSYIGRLIRDGARVAWRTVHGKRGAELARPVLWVKQASDTASSGWDSFWRVFVHLSVALALFHLLPFPSLDGGRMLFVAVEALRGKPVNPKVETVLHALGFVALIAAVMAIAASEVRRRPPSSPPPEASPSVGLDAGTVVDTGVGEDTDAG